MSAPSGHSSSGEAAGACLCGAVRFRVRLPTLYCGHCHCTLCRRAHAAGYVTWFGVERGALRVEAGEDVLRRYPSSVHATRSFCGRCGTPLFFASDRSPDRVDVALAAMDDPIDRPPQLHVFFDRRVPWMPVDEGLPRLGGPTGFDPLEED